MERGHQFEPWQIFSVNFLTFWIFTSFFDNFFTVFFLCICGGLILDYLHDFMKSGENEKKKLKKSTKFYCKGIPALPNFELEELRKANHITKSTFLTEIDDSDTEDSDEDEDETDNDKIFEANVTYKVVPR